MVLSADWSRYLDGCGGGAAGVEFIAVCNEECANSAEYRRNIGTGSIPKFRRNFGIEPKVLGLKNFLFMIGTDFQADRIDFLSF